VRAALPQPNAAREDAIDEEVEEETMAIEEEAVAIEEEAVAAAKVLRENEEDDVLSVLAPSVLAPISPLCWSMAAITRAYAVGSLSLSCCSPTCKYSVSTVYEV
jgi:hypothetical protein